MKKKKTIDTIALKVLYLEDSSRDIEMIRRLLINAGYDLNMDCTEKKKEFISLLRRNKYDVILSDFKIHEFDAFEALRLATDICPEVPFICISGTIGEETAIELIKQGVVDYVLKDRLIRLPSAIKRALDEVKEKDARRRAEAALRESEEIFKQFMGHSPVYVFFKDENIRAIRLSKNYETMLGKPMVELLGKSMDDLFPSKLAKSMVADDKRILKDGKEITVEEELNGRFYTTIKFPIHIEGKPRYLAGYTIDITERKQAEIALRESEKKYRELIDGMNETVWIIDFKGNIIDVNKTAVEVLGYSKEELLTVGLYGIDSSLKKEDIKALAKAMPSDKLQIFETSHTTKDGRSFPVEVYSSIVTYQGEKAILSIARNITERKRAEEALRETGKNYRLLFEQNLAGVYHTTLKGDILDCNDAFVNMLGYNSREELRAHRATDLYSTEIERDNFVTRLQIQGFLKNSEITLHRKDGTTLFGLESAALITGVEDTPSTILGTIVDITERKRAEKELLLSKQRWENTFDAIADIVCVISQEHEFIAINDAGVRSLKISRNEIIGRKCFELVHGTKAPLNLCPCNKLLKSGSEGFSEHEQGGRHYSLHAWPISDESGKVTSFVHIVKDITDRKRAEEALKNERILLRTLIDNIPDSVYIKDLAGRKTLANLAEVRYSGAKSEAEVLGKDDFEIYGKEMAEEFVADDQLVMQTGKPVLNLEGFILDKIKQKRWLLTSKLPLRDENNQIIGLIGICRDITERKQAEEALKKSEEKLKELFETAPVGYHELDAFGNISAVNQTELKMLGYSQEEMEGWPVWEFVADTDKSRKRVLGKLAGNLPPNKNFEQFFARRDGTSFPALVDDVILRNEHGVITGIRTTILDITERKRAEEALNESEQRFRRLFSASPDAIMLLDPTDPSGCWPIVDCNDIACEMNGYTREELIGKSVDILNISVGTPEERAAYLERIRREGVMHIEAFHRHRDSHIFPIEISTSLVNFKGHELILGIDRDITERKRAEQKNAEQARLLDIALDAIVVRDMDDKLIFWNKGAENLYGWTYEEAKTLDVHNFIDKDDIPKFERSKIEFLQNGSWEGELHQKTKDQHPIITYSRWTIVRDEKGTPSARLIITRDITERKRMEDWLRKLSRAVEQSPASVVITNTKGEIEYVNPKFTELTGYTMEEVLGKNSRFLKSGHTSPEEYKHLWETILSGKEWRGEFRNKKKDGTLYWEKATNSPIFDEKGAITHFVALEEDITMRKQTEEALQESELRYRRLVEFSPDAIAVHCDGVFVYANPAAIKLFGAKDASQLIGTPALDLVHPESKELVRQHIMTGLKNGKPLPNVEEKFQKLDGTVIDVEVTSLPIAYKGKSAIQLIIRDISEKKKMQSHLLQTQKVQSIGTLAGGIAHDFNNILGIVLAYSSVLERSITNPQKITESITAINGAVNRGAALVKQILTFARQTDVSIKPMSLPELVHEVVIMLQETFPKVIEFKEVFERGVPLINADHTQIHQAVLNLCVNARDAMPKGGVISLKIQTVPLKEVVKQYPGATFDQYVCLSVSDTGTGMDEAIKSRIFDPFFTTKELGKGTGLGLSVVLGVIESHYGFISVESKVGQGTTFHLYLPVPQEFKKGRVEEEKKTEEYEGGTETILFVEDEELLREVVQSTLESNGYKVFVAADGQEAVDIYKKHSNDISLVLTDIGLPKLSGTDEYALLKEINPKVKVIFASGFIALDARSELLKGGVRGFIQKPYNVTEVLQMVREVLDEKKIK